MASRLNIDGPVLYENLEGEFIEVSGKERRYIHKKIRWSKYGSVSLSFNIIIKKIRLMLIEVQGPSMLASVEGKKVYSSSSNVTSLY